MTKFRVGDHVRVRETAVAPYDVPGFKHPHAGKTGCVTEILGVLVRIGQPRALVKLDDGSGIAIVSLQYLEITKDHPGRMKSPGSTRGK